MVHAGTGSVPVTQAENEKSRQSCIVKAINKIIIREITGINDLASIDEQGRHMKEIELYQPVKDLLTGLGYDVKAEVAHIDVVALKETEWIAVELKTSFTLKLLLQATQRQKLTEKVYVALPAPSGMQRFSNAFKEYEHLLKRLELGLILVFFKESPRAELSLSSNQKNTPES